ncbi:hypothetical protein KBB25_00160 [Candidatus Gracilibacteria bacterium]|nr:hypothetical protein [Candidatus Gracilibacteria bacterium]
MVDEIIQHGNSQNSEALELRVKDISIDKLPGKNTEELQKEVSRICDLILGHLEEEKFVYVDPNELVRMAELIHSNKGRKKNQDVSISILTGDNTEGLRNSPQLRHHMAVKNFQNDLLHGYIFYEGGSKESPLACIYEIETDGKIEEYILLDKRIADHPLAAWKVVDLLKKKYKKLHKQYDTQKS